MPETDLLLFLVASLLLGVSPGPDNLFVMAQAAQHGPRAGLLVTLGLCTGLVVHTSLVALGLAAVFQSSALAYSLLTFLGAAYLLYLAWHALRSAVSAATADAGPQTGALPAGRLYLRGIVMNVTNPKVSLFFLAFLPQFVDPLRGPVTMQFVQLGALFVLATVFVFGGLALVAGGLGQRLRRSGRMRSWLDYATALLFTGLAVRLVLTT